MVQSKFPESRSEQGTSFRDKWQIPFFVLTLLLLIASILFFKYRIAPLPPDKLLHRAHDAFSAGDYDDAAMYSQSIVTHHPTYQQIDEAYYIRGNSLFYKARNKENPTSSDYALCIDVLTYAATTSSSLSDEKVLTSMKNLAKAYEAVGDWSNALDRYEVMRANFPAEALQSVSLDYAYALVKVSPKNLEKAYSIIDEYLASGTRMQSNHVKALQVKAEVAYLAKDYVTASQSYRELRGEASGSSIIETSYLREGQALRGLRKYTEAAALFKQGLQWASFNNGNEEAFLYNLGEVYKEQEEFTLALDFFAQCATTEFDGGEYALASLVRMIEMYLSQRDYENAYKQTLALLQRYSTKQFKTIADIQFSEVKEIFHGIKRACVTKGWFDQAIILVDQYYKNNIIKEEQYLLDTGDIYEQNALYIAPQTDLQYKDTTLDVPEDAKNLFIKSADAFAKVYQRYPYSSQQISVFWHAGNNYYTGGDYFNAIHFLSLYIEHDGTRKNHTLAVYKLGNACRFLGMNDKAIQTYDMNITKNPNNIYSLYSSLEKGKTYLDVGDYENASTQFLYLTENSDVGLSPDNAVWKEARFNLAKSLYLAGKYDDVLFYLYQFADWYEDDARLAKVRYWLAVSLWKLAETSGDTTQKTDYYTETIANAKAVIALSSESKYAAQIKPDERKMCYVLIPLMYTKLNFYEKALDYYVRLAEEYPQSKEEIFARRGMAQCYRKLLMFDAMKACYERLEFLIERYKKEHPDEDVSLLQSSAAVSY